MKVVIERFEGDFAVCELSNKQIKNIPKVLLEGAREGDIIDIVINREASQQRKTEIQKRFDSLKE